MCSHVPTVTHSLPPSSEEPYMCMEDRWIDERKEGRRERERSDGMRDVH